MTNREILDIAMAQSAVDLNCHKEDFLKSEPVIAVSAASAAARRYLELPFDCNLVSYGNNIVASISPQYRSFVEEYLNRNDKSHCFETPNLYELNQAFAPYHLAVCFMADSNISCTVFHICRYIRTFCKKESEFEFFVYKNKLS